MKRFAFRLQPLLNLRQSQEQILLSALAELQRERDSAEARLRLLKSRASELTQRAALRRLSEKNPASEYASYPFLCALDDEIADQAHAVHIAQQAVDAKMREAMEAMRARKALEKYRDKQREEHLRKEASEEMKSLDEGASQRFIRALR
ncbi:MAG: flagellar export protein FliJ [Armatimonadetes bacterium]|nr:flagellar export protein FliJ [Armatimonadota bacterium]